MADNISQAKKPSQILNYLFLGGKADAKAKDTLISLNIKYILNCTPQRSDDPEFGCPNFYQKDKTFVYKRIPIFDNKGEDIITHMDAAYKFIEEGRHYGNVLVHCHKGVSRSASFVIGYLMRKNEFTFNEALDYVKSIRSIVQPNEAFVTQLMTVTSNDVVVSSGAVSSQQSVISYCSHQSGPSMPPTFEDTVIDKDVTAVSNSVVNEVVESGAVLSSGVAEPVEPSTVFVNRSISLDDHQHPIKKAKTEHSES